MDNLISGYVKAAIKYKVNLGFSFSAFDITGLVRSYVGKNVFVPHELVRDLVHSTMASESKYEKVDNGQYIVWTPIKNSIFVFDPVTQFPKKLTIPKTNQEIKDITFTRTYMLEVL